MPTWHCGIRGARQVVRSAVGLGLAAGALLAFSAGWRLWNPVSGPTIEYASELNLGDRENGERVIARAALRNRGDEDLFIDRITSNCSCTGLELEQDGSFVRQEALRIPAGQSLEAAIRVTVGGVPIGAEMANAVSFRTNDPNHPQGRISVRVRRVHGGLTSVPDSVVFGAVLTGTREIRRVALYDNAAAPRVIESVVSLSPKVSVRMLPPAPAPSAFAAQQPGQCLSNLEVALDTKAPGDVEAAIEVRLKDSRRPPDRIRVAAKIEPPLAVFPEKLLFPRSPTASGVESAVCVVKSRREEAIQLSVGDLPQGVAAEVVAAPAPHIRHVRITWNRPEGFDPAQGKQLLVPLQVSAGSDAADLKIMVLIRPS